MKTTRLVNDHALKHVFDSRRFDALIALYPKNVFYYSGSPIARTQLLLDYVPVDPGCATLSAVIVVADGSNILVCPDEYEHVNRAGAWVEHFSFYTAHLESPAEAIARAVREAGLARSRMGIEATYLTVARDAELRALLPEAMLVSSDPDFEWIRALKTSGEIEIMKESADLLDEAMLEAFTAARAGDSEWDVHCRILEAAERRGAEHCRGVLHSGDNAEVSFSGAGAKKLLPGEIVRTDYAAFLRGYPSNLSRVAVVGQPSGLQRKVYANLLGGHHRIMEFMQPGVTGSEVFRFSIQAYADLGYLTTYRTILGHSLGLGYHERPILCSSETMQLETNMVFALEPKNLVPYHIQDQVVVGSHGAMLQSDRFDTRDMFVISA